MTEVCGECSSSNIRQQATFMFNPNEPAGDISWNDVECDDYYYCMECKDDCDAEEEDQVGSHVFKGSSIVDDCSLCGYRYAHKTHA